MHEYRVTKYNPAFRDHSGAYTKVEWTMFRQIGQTFSGVLLTSDEYERVEEAYIQAALSFLRESGLLSMRVAGLENRRKQPLAFKTTVSCRWTVSVISFVESCERIFGVDWKEAIASSISVGTTTCMSACRIVAPQQKRGRSNLAYMLRNLHLKSFNEGQISRAYRGGNQNYHRNCSKNTSQ